MEITSENSHRILIALNDEILVNMVYAEINEEVCGAFSGDGGGGLFYFNEDHEATVSDDFGEFDAPLLGDYEDLAKIYLKLEKLRSDFEDSDDDGSDILQEIRIARKVKAEADTVQFLETTLFMKPSQLMTRRKFQVWMQRAPEWMMLCAEWNDNIQLRNVVVSSDRTLWLRGRIAKGGEDRQIRLSNNLKRFQVRDAFFQQRKHVKNVIKAQARARGMFIRLEMLTKRKELAHRKRVQERQKEEIQENKERRIKSRRRKSIISLPPRTLSIAAVVSAAARAKKQFKVVENIL